MPLRVEAADLVGVTVETLTRWRQNGEGPPALRLTRTLVRYERAEVLAWLAARRRIPDPVRLASALLGAAVGR